LLLITFFSFVNKIFVRLQRQYIIIGRSYFEHLARIARTAPDEDRHRVIAATLRPPLLIGGGL